MKRDGLEEWMRDKITREYVEPASEGFYQSVWNRIRAVEPAALLRGVGNPMISFGVSCWRAVPAFAALLLMVALYGWFYPPDFRGQAAIAAESYVLDMDTAPSNEDLFYQIMHSAHVSELETEP